MALLFKKLVKEKGKPPVQKEFRLDHDHTVRFNSKGLVPVIVQDLETGEVLRLAYMDRWALDSSLEDKTVYIYHRRSQRMERLGKKDGIEYHLESVKLDESHNTLLFQVTPTDHQSPKTAFSCEITLFSKEDLFEDENQEDSDSQQG